MSIEAIIFMSTMGLIMVVQTILIFMQKTLIARYKAMLDDAYEKDDFVLKYCLHHIQMEAVEEEDFEKAQHCRNLIDSLNQLAIVKARKNSESKRNL